MPRIQLLEKHIAELIAAGEVVERPASVIKELVENSIDAGSTEITIEIQHGGINYIRIKDNGCGIFKEDVPVAFLRHATSKISSSSDLDAINSLGFRGEALASISAVAHVELITKRAQDNSGTRILIHGGDTELIEDIGAPNGTTIIVRDIFYNVPARMKFMKKDVGEGNAVAAIVDKIAMSHPEISFRFIRDRKETLYTPGDNKLASAIYGVYGKDFLNGLIPVKYEYQGIKVWGYISKPAFSRATRTMQNFFINGRFIKSRTTMAGIEEAFKGSIMVGKYPSCALHIQMDSSLLDVNVHPAKLDVRFANEKPIFEAVYHAVKSSLMQGDKAKEIKLAPKSVPKPINPYAPVLKKEEQIEISVQKPIAKPIEIPKPVQTFTPVQQQLQPQTQPKVISFFDSEPKPIKKVSIESSIEKVMSVKPETVKIVEEEPKKEIKKEVPFKLIGELFNTYIMLEYGEGLMLIDKHAAHERLLYEKLKKDSKSYAQTLLVSVTVTLDKISYNAVLEHLSEFEKAGFLIEDFGNGSVIVREAPLSFEGQDIESSIVEIAGYLTKNRMSISTEHLDWVYHNIACRAAIKAGKNSPKEELIDLARKLEENPDVRYCPHGRPIYTILKKTEIEKYFGRI